MEEMGLNRSFWKGRRILLTGHTGFKGGWLALWLSGLGARVSGLALAPPTEPSLFETAGVAVGLESDIRADVRDAMAVSDAVNAIAPELVFHLAAQPLVRRSYREPVETLATNVMGTVHVLHAALQHKSVRAVVVATSDKCYRQGSGLRVFCEDDPLGGADPYSASKACAELVVAAYRSSFGLAQGELKAIASVRAGNVIGGGDWGEDRLIPDCIRSLIAGTDIAFRYPCATRPWQHVLDAVSGYLDLGRRLLGDDAGLFAGPWNFGPDGDGCLSVSQVAELVATHWGHPLSTRVVAADLAESPQLRLDSTKAKTVLGWRLRWPIETAIAETVSWYRAWHRGEDMRAYSLGQIQRYSVAEA